MKSLSRKDVDSIVNASFGCVIASAWPRDAAGTVVVVGHEYFAVPQQQNVYLLLESLLAARSSTPILVEGMSGARKTSHWSLFGSSIGNAAKRQAAALEKVSHGAQAAAVLSELFPSTATIEGAEAADALERQRGRVVRLDQQIRDALPPAARAAMTSGDFVANVFSGSFGTMVNELEGLLNPRLVALFARERQFHKEGRPAAYATALGKLAGECDIDLEGYPIAHALVRGTEMEKTIDFDAVERERMEVVERIVAESSGPLDPERAKAVEAWVESVPMPEAVALPVEVGGIDDLPAWFMRLVALSQAYKSHTIPMGQYQRKLNGLLAALGVEIDPRSPLATYVEYVTLVEEVDTHELITNELPSLVSEIAAALTTSANERGVLHLRDQHRWLWRFHELCLAAPRVATFLAARPSVKRWVDEAVRLGDATLPTSWLLPSSRTTYPLITTIFEQVMPLLVEYYEAAFERSRAITKAAIERAAPASVLVCGRFHLHEVMRTLNAAGNVAWAVVGPYPARDSASRSVPTWNWTSIDSEWSMTERLPHKDT